MLKSFNDLKEMCKSTKQYFSRTKFGFCKNEGCYNKRRQCSAYCQECSDKFNN